jgi:Domain of unknown function (DUF4375)
MPDVKGDPEIRISRRGQCGSFVCSYRREQLLDNGTMMGWLSRQFVERILTEYEAGEAITAIDRYLAPRDANHAELGFTRPEMNLRMFCIYTGEVGNGGHLQFFLNPGGCYAERALVALREMRLSSLENILFRAIGVFPGARLPSNQVERVRLIESLPRDAMAAWDHLDREFYALRGYESDVLAYLRRNQTVLLQPETA